LLTDIIGTATGTNITENLGNCVAIIDAMRQANANVFIDLITTYDDIYANVLASDNANVIALIGDAGNTIGNIIAANPDATANLNTYFSAINTQLTREAELLTQAVIDIGNVQGNNQVAIMSFASSLPGYGLDTKVGGSAQYLELVANIDLTDDNTSNATSAGQSTVATLREGRTTAGLNAAGVGTAANAVESTPSTPPPRAVLRSSRWNRRQAQSQVIY
jgi:hypothetical protein